MPKSRNYRNLLWLCLSLGVIVLDRFSKIFILKHFALYEVLPVMPGFNLTLQYNTGAAFSFLAQAGGWQQWVFGGIAIAVSSFISIWLTRLPQDTKWTATALALIVGGALGNLWDRLNFGYVIDFIVWYVKNWYWPAFNLADSAIVLGAMMLILSMLVDKQPNKET